MRPFFFGALLFAVTGMAACAAPPRAVAPGDDTSSCAEADPTVVAKSLVVITLKLPADEVEDGKEFGRGAGVVIDAAGHILTPFHVAGRGSMIRAQAVYMENGRLFMSGPIVPMRVIAIAPEYDAALLAPVTSGARDFDDVPLGPPIAISPRQPHEGEIVAALMLRSSWLRGEVTHTDFPFVDTTTMTRVEIAGKHGDSGSPFTDRCGRMVGFMSRGTEEGPSFFVPVHEAMRALALDAAARETK